MSARKLSHDVIGFLIAVFTVVFVLFLHLGLSPALDSYVCKEYGAMTGREVLYKYFGGCYVMINGRWEQKEMIRKED